jgi:two-component system response regulator
MADNRIEILLVEDNSDDAELTLRTLRKNHVANRVLVLTDGQAAIDYLIGDGSEVEDGAAHLPRVVMLDLKLPKVDGIEVLRRIRGDDRTKLLPVVVLTSSNEESDLIRTYELGVNSYIVKPVDFSQFAATVRDVGLYWLLLNRPPG